MFIIWFEPMFVWFCISNVSAVLNLMWLMLI